MVPAISVGAQMAEGLALHERISRREIRRRCLDMLSRVQIRDPENTFDAYPHEFSGGMRQRIMLASVMLRGSPVRSKRRVAMFSVRVCR